MDTRFGPTPPGSEGDGGTRHQTDVLGSQSDSQGAGPVPAQPQDAAASTPPVTRPAPPPPPASQPAQSSTPPVVAAPSVPAQPVPAVPEPSSTTDTEPASGTTTATAPADAVPATDSAGVTGDDGVARQFMDEGDRGLAGQPDITAPKPRDEGEELPNGDEPPSADVRQWYQRPLWLAFCGLCGLLAILLLVFAMSNGEDKGKKAAAPAQKPAATAAVPKPASDSALDAASAAPAPIEEPGESPAPVAAASPPPASVGEVQAATPPPPPSTPAPPPASAAPSASQPAGAVGAGGTTVPSDAVVGLAAGASEQAGRAEAKADEAKTVVRTLEAKVAELQRKLDEAVKAGAADAEKLRKEFEAAKAALEQARKSSPPSPAPPAPATAPAPPLPASAGSGASAPSVATHLLVDPAAYLKFCLKYGGTTEGCPNTLKKLKK